MTFGAGELAIFEEICEGIAELLILQEGGGDFFFEYGISDLKNSTDRLIIRGSDLNYKTDQCGSTYPGHLE